MRAEAIVHGAVTIINAISIQKGAALGIDLWTHANVTLNNQPGGIDVRIKSDPSESVVLARKVVRGVFRRFKLEQKYGAEVEVDSNIPIARGLKSSSAAANAIALATVGALNRRVQDVEIVRLGVKAAIESGVTITGAFDDACASYFGNLVITDNRRMMIERTYRIRDGYSVLIHVPKSKSYTIKANVEKMKEIAPLIRIAHQQALRGNYWDAMCFNGYAHSVALDFNPNIAIEALSVGAVAAGLSGKGPAVAAVVPSGKVTSVRKAWTKYPGRLILAGVNRKKACIVR